MVVFNDAALSLIAIKQSTEGHGGPAAVSYARTDFAAVAAGFGIRAERVSDAGSYRSAFEAALRATARRSSTWPSTRRRIRRSSPPSVGVRNADHRNYCGAE